MRIIAGSLGGRVFNSPHGHRTHPMSDRVRGALFNTLGDIEGLTVLDAFAGSGALGFEAVSRGATSAVLLDNDKNAFQTMEANIKNLGITTAKAIHASANAWSDNNEAQQFDIVLLDPPYDDLQPTLLDKLASRHAKPGATIVLSLPPGADVTLTSNVQNLTSKGYGDATLAFYRRIS